MNTIELLPEQYRGSAEVWAIEAGLGLLNDRAQAALEDFLLQLDVDTAAWGLELWEREYGIRTEADKPPEYRRTRVISKMRGQGTTTAAMIKNMAESFSNGAVDVLEYPGEYRFEVKFVGTIGIPPNMDDLTDAIEEIKPAHLAYAYLIIYRTWGEVKKKTWGELKAHTWGEVKGGDI